MEKLTSLCRRRGFIYPGSDIYGGMANSWDYGPLGVQLKMNVKDLWWKMFVTSRDDMVGMDAAIIMNPKVWEASGHTTNFSDPLVECKSCHHRYRADHLLESSSLEPEYDKADVSNISQVKCPKCGGDLTDIRNFNLMFETQIGAVEGEGSTAYLRPETAAGMFVNFKHVVETSRKKIPFGMGQIGKAFRNEITTGNFIFRLREFEQMEVEYFVKENEWEDVFESWRKTMHNFAESLGLDKEKLKENDIPASDLAHYSKRTIDFEYEYPFGQKELWGLAYRTDHDLKQHMEVSGQDLTYHDQQSGERFLPHVVEPSLGVDRSILVALLSAYTEEEVGTANDGEKATRVVMKFPSAIAPVQVAVLPLSKKEELAKPARELAQTLRENFRVEYDETQSIGKRYRRQDEIGTPLCVTFDFESIEDNAVTVRDRDTMEQKRIKIPELESYIKEQLN